MGAAVVIISETEDRPAGTVMFLAAAAVAVVVSVAVPLVVADD
jgi:hypothetical protein